MRLAGKVAIVTGAARGIGEGIARCLAEEGARVVLSDLRGEEVQRAAETLAREGFEVLALAADVADEGQVRALVQGAIGAFGRADILVNNAGVVGAPGFKLGMPLTDVTEEDFDLTYAVNVKGVFLPTRAVLPHMKAQRWGRIINISSRAGRSGRETLPHYSAAKAAVILFTQAVAKEAGPWGVTVNAICPGLVWTPMWELLAGLYQKKLPHLSDLSLRGVFDHFVSLTPLQREQTPWDIGRAAAFLASEDARTITGQALLVDSGAVMF
ncbi:MAG: SDR family NAD(P)-dependent oxidoreductase [Nitrospinota bacterium]